MHQDGRPQLYFRAEDNGSRSLAFVLRTGRDPHAIAPDVRAAVRRIDPRLALAELRTMDEIVGDALRQQRISAVLIAGFALGALLLAAMGLFSVVSSAVTRRRHEFGVRLALGADHGRVLRLVLREGALLVTIGLLIGVPGVYLAGGFIKGVLVGVSPLDPATLLTVALGLALVAMTACYLPARRVLRIEPAQSLREVGLRSPLSVNPDGARSGRERDVPLLPCHCLDLLNNVNAIVGSTVSLSGRPDIARITKRRGIFPSGFRQRKRSAPNDGIALTAP